MSTQVIAPPWPGRWLRGVILLALIGLAAAAQWILSHRGLPSGVASWPILERLNAHPGLVGLALYALALALFLVILSDPSVEAVGGLAVTSTWREGLVVLAVLALAAWARLYRIHEMPPGLWLDETDIARQALEIVNGARPRPWHVARLEVPWAYHYYVALFYWLLGPGYLTVKLPAIVSSVLVVIPLYLLAREMVRPSVAAAVIALYATSRWGINVARWGHVNALTPFFACLVLWLVWRGLHTGRWGYWIGGGIAMGLSQYTYQGARAIPVIVALFIIWRALFPRGYLRRYTRQIIALYVAAFLVYAPLGWTYLNDPLLFIERGRGVSVFNPLYTLEPGKAIWHNILAYAQAFHYRGDINPRHNLVGAPQLEEITAVLLILGLAYAVTRWRRPSSVLLLIWCAVFLIAGVLTQGAPNTFRIYGILPAFLLLCGLALDVLWSAWERIDWLSAEHLGTAVLIATVAWAGLDDVTTYFSQQGWQPTAWSEFNVSQTRAGQFLQRVTGDAPERWHVYLSRAFYGFSPIDVINPDLATERLILPDHVPLPPDRVGDTIYIVDPYLEPALDLLQRYYPESWREVVRDPRGNRLFIALVIPGEATARRGLRAKYWQGTLMAGPPAADVPVVDPWRAPPKIASVSAPYALRLIGGLRLTEAGPYRFRLMPSSGMALLYLNDIKIVSTPGDGKPSPESAPVWLPQGVILFRLDRIVSEGASPQPVRVEWMPPGAEGWEPLPLDRVLPVIPPPGGLIAAYYEGDRFTGEPVRVALDPLLLEDNAGQLATYAVRWLGKMEAERGEHGFRLSSDDGSRLYVNNQLLVDLWGLHGPQDKEGSLLLSAGRVPLELRYFDYGGSNILEAEWRPPGEDWKPLRYAMLRWDSDDVKQALTPLPSSSAIGIPTFSAQGAALGLLPPVRVLARDQRWPHPQRDENFHNRLLKIKDDVFDQGIGAFGPTEIAFDLRGQYARLSGAVGVDRDTTGDHVAWFQIELDGRVIWDSGPRYSFDPALPFDLDVSGGGTLVLRTHEGAPGASHDAVDWVNLRLVAR
ncbi:MAG TPA: hypothetical protein G4O02_10730 [Caldilineae bacterium]|nr:hypothetical protein [Caldilineae bacterium]